MERGNKGIIFYSSIIYIIKGRKWEQFSFREIKDLIESNIRQRGDVGGSAKKVGLRIKELERLYGIKVGNPNYEKNSQLKTQNDLANEMGMDVRTLQNYKLLSEMIPELEELLDTGIVTKTTTLAMMKYLSTDEQRELISHLETLCHIYLYDYSIIKDDNG